VVGVAVLDMEREHQWSDDTRQKSRAGWERERVVKFGFSSMRRQG
jgi:hypothetical protein